MNVEFKKDYLQELFEKGKSTDKKVRFPSPIIKKYCQRVQTLMSAPNLEALYPLKSLNFEALSGNKKGLFSIRIDLKYRLEFSIDLDSDTLLSICNLQDITNHYD